MRFPYIQHATIADTGRNLRAECERRMLEQLIDHLTGQELAPEQTCRIIHAFCELKKQDVAHDHNAVVLQVAETRDRARRVTARLLPGSAPEPTAPYGRDDEGKPLTRRRFKQALGSAVNNIYGVQSNTNESNNDDNNSNDDKSNDNNSNDNNGQSTAGAPSEPRPSGSG